MEAVSDITGRAYPLGRDNIDTDVILPGRFLKTISRTGLGIAAFEPLRAEVDNPLSDPEYSDAPILIAGKNFGCGSSREHAVWAMMDFGIRAVIAESYSDIFAANAVKNGLLAVALSEAIVEELIRLAGAEIVFIDLPLQTVRTSGGMCAEFEIDPFWKRCLMEGTDEIDLTLQDQDKIAAFEANRMKEGSWLEQAC